MKITLRNANNDDLPEIVEILNQAIRTRKLIGFTDEFTVEDREEWFAEHLNDNYPIIVAEQDNIILGWASISPYRKGRGALDKTVEVSYFIHNDHQRRGIGNTLLLKALEISKNTGKSTILAIIFHTNTGSTRLLEKNNFKIWGILPEVGELNENKLNHVYYGKKL